MVIARITLPSSNFANRLLHCDLQCPSAPHFPRRTVVAQMRSAGSSILLGPPEDQPPMLSHITGILYKRKTFTTTMKRIHRQHTLVFTHEHNLV